MVDSQKCFEINLLIPNDVSQRVYETNVQELCGTMWMLQINLDEKPAGSLVCMEDPERRNIWDLNITGSMKVMLWDKRDATCGERLLQLKEIPFKIDNETHTVVFKLLRNLRNQITNTPVEHRFGVRVSVELEQVAGVNKATLEDFSAFKPGVLMVRVGEKVFNVNRATLARVSLVFRDLIYDQHRKPTASEIQILDTDAKTFEAFLQFCHSKTPYFDFASLPGILELAERYGTANVKVECEQYLTACHNIKLAEGIRMADSFQLKDLMTKLLGAELEISDFEPIPFSTLSAHTQELLKQKMVDIDKERKKSTIKVRSKNGERYFLSVRADEKIVSIARRVAGVEGNQLEKQQLWFNGGYMQHERMLSEYDFGGSEEIQSVAAD